MGVGVLILSTYRHRSVIMIVVSRRSACTSSMTTLTRLASYSWYAERHTGQFVIITRLLYFGEVEELRPPSIYLNQSTKPIDVNEDAISRALKPGRRSPQQGLGVKVSKFAIYTLFGD